MGVTFALIALLSWGFGDFLVQKGARKFGKWLLLFYMTAFASIILLPFIYQELFSLFSNHKSFFILSFTSIIFLGAGLINFEALKVGKISVVEPIFALEIPITAILGILIIKEFISLPQVILILLLISGIVLLSIRSFDEIKKISLEKGVIYSLITALCMGTANFVIGLSARDTSPLLVIWFTHTFMALASLIYLLTNNKVKDAINYLQNNKLLILATSFVDTSAWIAFSFSTLYIPIAISTSISESYIALAAMLGIIFNKEKLKKHQFIGLIIAIISVMILAKITG